MNDEFGSIAAGGAEALGRMDPYELLGALRDIANPWLLAWEALPLLVEWTRIAAGIGDRQLPEKDHRFSDPTWRDNPLYNRWAQAYLAWCEMVDRLVDDADLDESERSRAHQMTPSLVVVATGECTAGSPVGTTAACAITVLHTICDNSNDHLQTAPAPACGDLLDLLPTEAQPL